MCALLTPCVPLYSILTGWGKHSKIAGSSTLRCVIEVLPVSIGAQFQVERFNIGRFVSPSAVVAAWLRVNILLQDERVQGANPSNLVPRLQALQSGSVESVSFTSV
jgi:hypothetical protein